MADEGVEYQLLGWVLVVLLAKKVKDATGEDLLDPTLTEAIEEASQYQAHNLAGLSEVGWEAALLMRKGTDALRERRKLQ